MSSTDDQAGTSHRDVVQVFEPNALDLPPLREYVAELWARRRFLVELAESEVRGLRSSTLLGELWTLADPLFQATIYCKHLLIAGFTDCHSSRNIPQIRFRD